MKRLRKWPRGGASVPCPTCGLPSRVVFTRRQRLGGAVTRLRRCRDGHRFHTEEQTRSDR